MAAFMWMGLNTPIWLSSLKSATLGPVTRSNSRPSTPRMMSLRGLLADLGDVHEHRNLGEQLLQLLPDLLAALGGFGLLLLLLLAEFVVRAVAFWPA